MGDKRPKLSIPVTRAEIFIEIVSALVFVLNFVMLIATWNKLPGIIPSHFNAAGKIDAYGSKFNLFYLLPVTAVFYGGLTLLAHFPHVFNYVVEITEQNAEAQYRLARTFMRVLKAELIVVFTYLEYSMIISALNYKLGLSVVFLPLSLAALCLSIGFYVYKSIKLK